MAFFRMYQRRQRTWKKNNIIYTDTIPTLYGTIRCFFTDAIVKWGEIRPTHWIISRHGTICTCMYTTFAIYYLHHSSRLTGRSIQEPPAVPQRLYGQELSGGWYLYFLNVRKRHGWRWWKETTRIPTMYSSQKSCCVWHVLWYIELGIDSDHRLQWRGDRGSHLAPKELGGVLLYTQVE